MTFSSENADPVNFCDPRSQDSQDLGSLFIPPGRRHAVQHRVTSGEASPTEIVHHLLGAHADDPITGGLGEVHIILELLSDLLASDRHIGTLANIAVTRVEVLIALCEQLDIDGKVT